MSYKKWVYKYKYLKSEENEFAEKLQEYTIKFNEDFEKLSPPPQDIIPPPEEETIEEEIENIESKPKKKGKDLYKKLSKEFHPDKGGSDEDFKNLNSLYQDEDILGMYVKAEELGLEIEITDEDELKEVFEKNCNSLQEKINFYQTTAAWRWGTAKEEEKDIMAFFIENQANVKRRQK